MSLYCCTLPPLITTVLHYSTLPPVHVDVHRQRACGYCTNQVHIRYTCPRRRASAARMRLLYNLGTHQVHLSTSTCIGSAHSIVVPLNCCLPRAQQIHMPTCSLVYFSVVWFSLLLYRSIVVCHVHSRYKCQTFHRPPKKQKNRGAQSEGKEGSRALLALCIVEYRSLVKECSTGVK